MKASELDLGRLALERGLLRGLGTEFIDGFELRGRLGQGAMGSVYRAWHPGLSKEVALKVLPIGDGDDERGLERFMIEAQAAGRLSHPNIVGVHDAKRAGGSGYIVMELVEGPTMEELLEAGGLPVRGGAVLVEKVARAAAYAHGRGVIHRDIKPGNIIVDAAGEPRLLDFGLARLTGRETQLTRSGASMGTPAYMPPEQVRGAVRDIGPRSDVYSLGVVLYRILTGRVPFDGSTIGEVYDQILRSDPPPPRRFSPGCPPELQTICLKAIEKDPSRRYATAEDFAEDLRRWLAGEPISAQPASHLSKVWRRAVRHRKTLAPVVAAAVALATGLGWMALRQRDLDRLAISKSEALRQLEVARPAIERASHAFYREDADVAELRRGVEEVRARLEAAIRLDPSLTAGHYLLGRAWQMTGRMDRAEASWRRAIELQPGFGPAHYQLARLLVLKSFITGELGHGPKNLSNPVEATRLIREAAAELDLATTAGSGFDDDLQREVAKAILAWLRQDHAVAAELCRAGIARFGRAEGVESLHWVGGLLLQGDAQIEAYTRALAIRPKDPVVLMCRAMQLALLGRLAEAVRDCSSAIEAEPSFAGAYLQRAAAKGGIEDYDGAIADYTEFLRIEPTTEAGWTGRAAAHGHKQDWARAEDDLTVAIRLNPEDAQARYLRGQARWIADRVPGAIEDCDALLKLDAGHSAGRQLRAQAHSWMKEYAAAVADYDELLRREPARYEVYPERGQTLMMLGRSAAAIADYRKALELAPADWTGRADVERFIDEAREQSGGDF